MSKPGPARDTLLPPLLELSMAGLVLDTSGTHAADIDVITLNGELNERLASKESCKTFLSVQADMLVATKGFTTPFMGLEVNKKGSRDSVGVYDTETRTISVPVSKKGSNAKACGLVLSDVLHHEMIHAIDHTYRCKSEEKVVAALSTLASRDDERLVMTLVNNSFADDQRKVFETKYINPAQGSLSFVDACRAPEGGKGGKQKKAARDLAVEFSSFAFETIFHEMGVTTPDSLLTRCKLLEPVPIAVTEPATAPVVPLKRRKATITEPTMEPSAEALSIAQEVIAGAVYDINAHIIKHIEKTRAAELECDTPTRELHTTLCSIQTALEAPHSRLAAKMMTEARGVAAPAPYEEVHQGSGGGAVCGEAPNVSPVPFTLPDSAPGVHPEPPDKAAVVEGVAHTTAALKSATAVLPVEPSVHGAHSPQAAADAMKARFESTHTPSHHKTHDGVPAPQTPYPTHPHPSTPAAGAERK